MNLAGDGFFFCIGSLSKKKKKKMTNALLNTDSSCFLKGLTATNLHVYIYFDRRISATSCYVLEILFLQ